MTANEWASARLHEVAQIIDCKHRTPKYQADGIAIVSPGNITWEGLQFSSCRRVSASEHEALMDHCEVQVGDIVFGRNQSVGVASIVADDTPFALGQDTVLIKPLEVTTGYLVAFFQSQEMKRQLRKVMGGSTFGRINLKDLRNLVLPIPPIDEQREIAATLDIWNRAINTSTLLISNSKAQKRSLARQLFSQQVRLPPFSDPWKTLPLSALFERIRDKNEKLSDNVLTISAQHGLVSQTDFFKKSVAGADLSGYTLLRRGDFAYNKSYSAGYPLGAIKPLSLYDEGIVSSLYICFRLSHHEANHDFYRHYFETGQFDREIYGIAQEGARNHGLLNVSITDFFDTRIEWPDPKEQEAIADVLNCAEQETARLISMRRLLQAEKAGLMQQLLTGKRRVSRKKEAA